MHLLLTRPEADDDPMEAALTAAGHRVTRAPLLAVVPTGHRPSFDGVQALVVTSRNALKALAGAPLTDTVLGLPLFAVGPGTAALALALGFRRIVEGPGNGRGLADVIRGDAKPDGGDLLHLAGATLAFDLQKALAPDGFTVRVETLYRTDAADELPTAAVEALGSGTIDGVILMSPRTAMVYAALTGRAGLVPKAVKPCYFCLSEAVARELHPLGEVRTRVAKTPNAQEMLALITREAPDSD